MGAKRMSRLAKTRSTTGLATAFVLFVAGVAFTASRNAAGDVYADQEEQSKAEIGLRIAPVPLNMSSKSRELVGLGSYIVNALADCNGCHTASSQETYVFGGVPFFGQKPTIVNPAVYLGGGQDFGTLDPLGQTAHIVSRNLTPDKTGRPEGGHTFEEFRTIMRTGADLDHIHPTCASGATDTSHCVPPPFDGGLLQVMPWPAFQNMTDRELRAIYEY